MASTLFIRILLALYICSSSIFVLNAAANNDKLRSVLLRRKYPQFDSNSIEPLESFSPSSNTERRNVIMPRICYFARVAGTSARQKLCLPYNGNKRR